MGKKTFIPGLVIGRLTLLEEENRGKKNFWKTQCQCGNSQYFRTDYLSQQKCIGSKFECSQCKHQRRFPPLTGKIFGRLTVIKEVPSTTKNRMWLVKCECGVEKELPSSRLTRKDRSTRSCGCFSRKIHSKWVNTTQYPPAHQLRTKFTPKLEAHLYHVRNAFVAACYRKEDPRYPNHGEKGHTVCDLWRNGAKDYVKWAISKGYKPGDGIYLKKGKTIFSPKNCYISKKSQFAKINNSKLITYNGKTQSITDWAFELGCTISCLSSRLKKYHSFGIEKIMDLSWVKEKKQIYGTEHFESDIIRLYSDGNSYEEIANKTGCSYSTIKRFLKKNNIQPRPSERRSSLSIKTKLKEIHKMVQDGKSLSQISSDLIINYPVLRYHYKNYLNK